MDLTNLLVTNDKNNTVGGGVMVCPSHDAGGRSYTMNYWATSAGLWRTVSGRRQVFKPGTTPIDRDLGRGFNIYADFSSDLMLMSEAWGLFRSETDRLRERKWFTIGDVGRVGKPGERFGYGAGVPMSQFPGQWAAEDAPEMVGDDPANMKSYIPFYRHPRRSNERLKPVGRANMGFLDGHVDIKRHTDLVNIDTGVSTFDVLWSPDDRKVEGVQ